MRKKIVSFLLVLCMLVSIIPAYVFSANTGDSVFKDVDTDIWYYEAVEFVYTNGLMTGVTDSTFEPDSNLTRSMFVTVLGRLDGFDTSTYVGSNFPDVESDTWYTPYVAWAEDKGIVSGYENGYFGTEDSITREEMATIIARYIAYKGITLPEAEDVPNSFADASSVSDWAVSGLELMRTSGIIQGDDEGNFNPHDTTTRAQAAAVFMRLQNAIDISDYVGTDEESVTQYVLDYYGANEDDGDDDGDGLSNIIEITITGTDPTLADTDGNGVNDGDEDSDGDGLTNQEEVYYGTDIDNTDSDFDGLSDYDEVNVYGTDPLNEDSDGDGLTDYEEVQLGLDSLNAVTDGKTPDAQREFYQVLDEDAIDNALYEADNITIPSVSGNVTGLISKHVSLSVANVNALSENTAVKGIPVQVNSDYVIPVTLSFDISSFSTEESANLGIMQYTDEGLVSVDTINSSNTLETEVTGDGIYAVVDLYALLNSVGVDVEEITEEVTDEDTEIYDSSEENSNTSTNQILLDDYQYVTLDMELSPTNGCDTDGDGITDYDEITEVVTTDLTDALKNLLLQNGVSEADVENYAFEENDSLAVNIYSYYSNPVLVDTDYDGIDDAHDASPRDNAFSGTLSSSYATSSVEYVMDYSTFLGDNTIYNSNLAQTSLIWSSLIYPKYSYQETDSESAVDIIEEMKTHGMDVYNNSTIKVGYSDDDRTEIALGNHVVSDGNKEVTVVGVVIRGTNSSEEEWSSNFDMGNTSEQNPEWTTDDNHKGFDVTANRVLDEVESYVDSLTTTGEVVYWVTGHSRGAAVANLVGAYLTDSGEKAFTYTFAAPNTTMASTAADSKYNSIFNVVNEDDVVTYIPMTQWNYTKYGQTATIKMSSNMTKEWREVTGKKTYCATSASIRNLLMEELSSLADGRDDIYTFKDSTSSTAWVSSIEFDRLSDRSIKYTQYTAKKLLFIKYYDVDQSTAFYMQYLAEVMSSETPVIRALATTLALRYQVSRGYLILSVLGGIENPHYCDTYYVITNNLSSSDFV